MADDAAAPEQGPITPSVDDESAAGSPVTDADEAAPDETAPDEATVGDEATASAAARVRVAMIAGLVAVVALAALTGWLGWRTWESHRAEQQRALFLQVGRQSALNLTTIDFRHADADVQRILDSATGSFYDDFQQRAQPFAEVVRQVKSRSVGTVTEAGIEDETDEGADVLVAVTVNTAVEGQPEQAPRAWRMRLTVQRTGDDAKVAKVDFVP
jgi:Mce-associated membrane protein